MKPKKSKEIEAYMIVKHTKTDFWQNFLGCFNLCFIFIGLIILISLFGYHSIVIRISMDWKNVLMGLGAVLVFSFFLAFAYASTESGSWIEEEKVPVSIKMKKRDDKE